MFLCLSFTVAGLVDKLIDAVVVALVVAWAGSVWFAGMVLLPPLTSDGL